MADKDINFKFGGSSDELEKMLKRVEGGFEHLEKMAHVVEGAFAFEKIREGFMSFVEESDKAEMANQKFAITLASTGQAGDPAAINELAESLENLTTFEARTTTEAAAMMARFRLSQDQIETMLPAVQDLSSYLGQDLVSASDAVGRAVQVGAQGLRALNLGFNASQRAAFDMADAQGRVAMITERIHGTMGGYAQMMASTASGAAKQFENSLNGLRAAIGGVLEKPVAATFRALTDTVKQATGAFNGLTPVTRGVLVAMATGVAGVAAIAAGFTALSGAASILVPLFGPLIAGFAAVMNSEISLAAATGTLEGAFVGVRTAAMTAWGGVIAPLLAIGAAVVGVTVFLGSMARNWEDIKFSARAAVFAIRGWFNDMVDSMVTMWTGFVDGVIEKFVYIKSMLSGMSPEAAGEAARTAVAESGGAAILAKIKTAVAEAAGGIADAASGAVGELGATLGTTWEVGKTMLADSATDFKKDFGAGVELLVAGAKRFGIDFEAMGAKKAEPKKMAGGKGGGGEGGGPISMKELFAGVDDKDLKKAEATIAASMVRSFGSGNAGLAAASKFLTNLETMSSLSESTLTTILTRTGTGIGEISGIANELRNLSDSTVQSLLKASGYNMEAVLGVAPALRGVSDATVAALLRATGGSLTALASVAPHVRQLSDDTIKQFMALGGSLSGLAHMGDDFSALGPAMATATAAADAYWKSFDGQMALLKADAIDAGMGIASSMGAAGGAFTNVMSALSKGDIMGAVVGGISSIVTQSKAFQEVSKIINEMFSNFAQALNPLFDGLAPILLLVGSLLSSVGGAIKAIFTGIQPIFALISGILAPIFTIVNGIFGGLKDVFKAVFAPIMPIVKSLMPIFKIIGDLFSALTPILIQLFMKTGPIMPVLNILTAVFKALEPVFKLLSEAIGSFINLVMSVFKSLAGIYNNIVTFVANVVQHLISIIPGMGDAAKKFADSIRGATINVSSLDVAMKQVTTDASTQSDVTFPALENAVDGAAGSANNMGQQLGNLPAGFKINLAEFNATTAASADAMKQFLSLTSGNLGAPDATNVPTVVVGSLPSVSSTQSPQSTAGAASPGVTIFVNNPDPSSLAAIVKSKIEALSLQSTGNPNASSRGYSTPPTASSFK